MLRFLLNLPWLLMLGMGLTLSVFLYHNTVSPALEVESAPAAQAACTAAFPLAQADLR